MLPPPAPGPIAPAADHFAPTEFREAAGQPPTPTRGNAIVKGGIVVLLLGVLVVGGFLGVTFLRGPGAGVTPTTPASPPSSTRVIPTGASAPPVTPPRTPDYGAR